MPTLTYDEEKKVPDNARGLDSASALDLDGFSSDESFTALISEGANSGSRRLSYGRLIRLSDPPAS